jgi:CRISPR-associated protein Cmr2
MTQYLFLFTIVPVQSFIAQARKTQDLYAGSFLLSHLIDIAITTLKKKKVECEPIFPAKKIKSKPNRFIAEIGAENSEKIEEIGKYVEGVVRSDFKNIAEKVQEKLNLSKPMYFDEQVRTHLQVNWVALPLEERNYTDTYKELERYLGAIKNVRKFQQLEETGRKCSLCGERNVKVYRLTDEERKKSGLEVRQDGLLRKLYVKREEVAFFEPQKESDNLKVQKGEGLCAVCFIKRFADKYFENVYVKNYPSTAEIALMDSLSKLDSKLLNEYKKTFSDNFDAELYYKDNLTERYFKKNNYPSEKLEDTKAKFMEIHKIAKGLKLCKYYAILMLDGDSMGRWISGKFLRDKTQLLEFHEKLTDNLGSFAKNVEDIIKEPRGKLVYAGGDDVLAFINLNYILPVMKDLRAGFPKFEEFGFEITDNKKSSASVGITIAHYKTPLSEVLKWVRKMEKEAKLINDDKDAFAIAVLKRSGETRKTIFKWQYDTLSVIEILESLLRALKQKDFSNTFIKNLGIEFRRLMDEKGKYKNNPLIKTELKRLIGRSCMMTRGPNETKEGFLQRKKRAIDDLTEKLDMLYKNSKSLDNFLSALDIADFIEREALNDSKN